jgi:hypothetical protein
MLPNHWAIEELPREDYRRRINKALLRTAYFPELKRDTDLYPRIYRDEHKKYHIGEYGYSNMHKDTEERPPQYIAGPFDSFDTAYAAYKVAGYDPQP